MNRHHHPVGAIAAAVALMLAAPAWPQIVADPSAPGRQRPTVLSAGNGVALVNIQTPSAAGVSRNSYRQFDVGAPGAILNNSRGEAQTQLGGWVAGNPWLATGGARIILNEVNSSDPSWLKGPIEVAGQRAEVVIANPSGIQVDGAAFINASGVTLTTGTPVFNGGALDAYLVQRGQVSVEGAGLDTRGADATTILARATQLNAALWAQRLRLVSGANTIDAASQLPTGSAPPTGEAPAFALDVAAVGGMYAGQIQLIGTEAGLGVNNQGVISAESGPLELRADGWLVNKGSLQSNADLTVQTRGVDNAAGAVIVGERVGLSADTVNNGEGAVIAARGDLSIQARASISNRRGGLILSGADMALAADRIENRSARIEALGELDVKARVLINANEHLQTEVTTDGGTTTTRTLYFTPGGEVDASEIAWMAIKPLSLMQGSEGWNDYVRYGRPWILTRASAEALGLSDPRFNAWYHGPEPFVPAGIVTVGSGDSEAQVWQDAQFNYRRGDPIWAALGVAPPPGEPPGPMPRPPVADGAVPVDRSAYQRALAAWQDQAAPWVALGEKLGAVRSAINAELRPFDIYQTVTETRPALKTLHSEPGQILAGGNVRLNASEQLSNQDSEIIAGGTLHTPGAAVDNQASEVAASLTRRGTAYTWGVVDHTCEGLTCQTHYGWVQTPVDQRIPLSLKVSALRQQQGAADAPTAPSVDLNNALFKPAASPAATYLIETDPRFTDRRQWMGSDHQLALLGVDPNTLQKRLGDGFIEQRLVREQIAQLTGQRFLGDYQDDDAQYQALLDAGATFAQAHQLRPGIALTAEQVAALTSDIVWLETQVVTLPDGSQQTALVPKVYLMPRPGDLAPSGSLIAGRQVQLNLSGGLLNSGTVAGRELVLIDAQGIQSSGRIRSEGVTALRAQDDIDVQGGELSARDALLLDAGRDLKLASTTAHSTDGTDAQAVVLDRVARLSVSAQGGQLIAHAGRDIELLAAGAQADVVDMHADRDMRLGTVDTREALDATRDESNYGRVQRSAEVGSWVAGKQVNLSADRDVHMRAAQVQANGDLPNNAGLNGENPYYEDSTNGRLSVHAGRNLDIDAGQARYQVEHGMHAKSSDILGASSTTTRRLDSHTQAQGSALGGRNVDLSADGDITFKGSSAVADENLDVQAGGKVRILAERTEHRQERFKEDKSSGLYGSGAGVTLGSQQQSSEQRDSGTGAAGSTLGAIGGNVTIRAGQAYEQVGSDLLAGAGDINVHAKTISVTEARTDEQRWQEDKMSQSGLTLGVGGAVVQAMQAAAGTVEALSETKDKRMQALGVATAGLQIQQGMAAASQAAASPAESGVSVNISIGASSSRSTTEGSANNAQGSRVYAGGNVTFIAEGAGEDSDILVRGSEINARKTVRLKAEGNVDLRAAENTVKERTDSKNSSGSVGIGFQLGGTGAGFGITASASAGKGHAEGEALSYTNTHVTAGEKVVVESGGDTALDGAVISAPRIEGDVQGDLHIESLQDRASYHERSRQAGGSVSFGANAGGASFSSGATDIHSEYVSVTEQSGMRAGDGGFDVRVKGKTVLKGGAITSTQVAVEEGRNHFASDGGVELQDVQNGASYKASGWSVNAGVYASDKKSPDGRPVLGQDGKPVQEVSRPSGAGWGEDKGSASSTTQAGISGIAGDKDARTGDAQSGISPIFEKEKVKDGVEAQVDITQGFGQQAVPAWRDYANRQFEDAVKAGDEEAAQCWGPDGACRAAGHALIGGLSGGIEGASAAALSSAGAPHLQAFLQSQGVPDEAARAITQLGALGAGAAVGGSAGASAGLNEASHNAVMAIPILVEGVVAGGAAAARACLSSPACLNALRMGGAALVAKVASLVDPADLAQIPGFGSGPTSEALGPLVRPSPGMNGGVLTTSPANGSEEAIHTGGNQLSDDGPRVNPQDTGYGTDGVPQSNNLTYADNPSKQESPVWGNLLNAGNGRKTSGQGSDRRYYEWDYTHGDIEVYDRRGRHLGSMNPSTGEMYKPPVPGRKVDL